MAKTKSAAANQVLRQRAAQNRVIRQEELRNKFKGVEYLRQIDDDYKELVDQSTTVKKAKSTESDPYKQSNAIAKADCLARLAKVRLDVNFRRLAKVLPDLKAIEITDSDGNNPYVELTKAILAATKDNLKI